ncbi:glutathione S-transferase C-terminal domain-containing protein [Sphingobium sp. AS12]|uniref:glutathione S-transferase family protein n=1 Tax=Sphingobium sp. AS12 TaxID=2849495 RepID=UPI001C318D23|nr:glutathione S-transferase C-terminal domain-containing protein [Sphingobium sp. AS12]MBV2150092.1 glutathione S-transferase C-terminal domain-containing protein [Sphingobium sp. AS12]
MIRFYFHPTPNPAKIALFLEEAGLDYELVPVDTSKGEQHQPGFRAINPNGKVPAIVDTEWPGGEGETRIFDSNAILLYLAEKTGRFLGSDKDRPELLSWLFFVASGLGPFSGQAVHFQRMAPDVGYAVNRYRREAERHYQVLDEHLIGRAFIVGDGFTIADMAAWGWIDRATFVLPGSDEPLATYPNIKRWFDMIDGRPAVTRARQVGAGHVFKKDYDEETRRALFPSNYPPAG